MDEREILIEAARAGRKSDERPAEVWRVFVRTAAESLRRMGLPAVPPTEPGAPSGQQLLERSREVEAVLRDFRAMRFWSGFRYHFWRVEVADPADRCAIAVAITERLGADAAHRVCRFLEAREWSHESTGSSADASWVIYLGVAAAAGVVGLRVGGEYGPLTAPLVVLPALWIVDVWRETRRRIRVARWRAIADGGGLLGAAEEAARPGPVARAADRA